MTVKNVEDVRIGDIAWVTKENVLEEFHASRVNNWITLDDRSAEARKGYVRSIKPDSVFVQSDEINDPGIWVPLHLVSLYYEFEEDRPVNPELEGDSVVMGPVYSMRRSTPEMTGASKVLANAIQILSDRGKRYDNESDDPYPAVTRTAALWSAYLGYGVSPQRVADMMTLHKLARLSVDPNGDDHRVDGINYLAIAEDLSNGTSD
jgi:hypothetical protein